MTAVYYDELYESSHSSWGHCGDFYVGSTDTGLALSLNPRDSRGYRLILWKVNDFGRAFSKAERQDLFHWALEVEDFLRNQLGIPEVQIFQTNNTSHRLVDGTFMLGNARSPAMLRLHLVCRGVLWHEYCPGVPLTGPDPGEMFDLDFEFSRRWDPTARDTFRDLLIRAQIMPRRHQAEPRSIRVRGHLPVRAGFWASDGLLVPEHVDWAPCQNGDWVSKDGSTRVATTRPVTQTPREFWSANGIFDVSLGAYVYSHAASEELV